MIHTEVGYDCAEQIKGRKRHVLVDTLGLLVVVVVTAANLPERAGATLVFAQVKKERSKFWRLVKIWVRESKIRQSSLKGYRYAYRRRRSAPLALRGYKGKEFMKWVMDTYRWILETVLRPDKQKGFKILPRRWVVERTFGWCSAFAQIVVRRLVRLPPHAWCRRLNKDYEVLPATCETMIRVAMIRLMLRRLA